MWKTQCLSLHHHFNHVLTLTSSSICLFNSSICCVKACLPLVSWETRASFSSIWRPNSPGEQHVKYSRSADVHSLTNTHEVNQGKDLDTVFCQETCFLATQVIDLTDIFVILSLQFTQLVLKSAAQLFKVSLVRQERSSSACVHFQHVCIDFKDVSSKHNSMHCLPLP